METNPLSRDVRTIVREVLAEVLASRKSASGTATVQSVRIATDNDLARFVARLIQELDDPTTSTDLRSGARRFTLRDVVGSVNPPVGTSSPPGTFALQGVITESRIERCAPDGALVLGAGAILTPLARDKARKLGLKIERVR